MRHTFATWTIESGVQASYLAGVMGTSIRELEDTCSGGWGERTTAYGQLSTPTTRRRGTCSARHAGSDRPQDRGIWLCG